MLSYFSTLLQRSWRMFLAIAKIILPVMIIVQIAQHFGLIDWIGQAIAPAMALMHLPPEAGIVWATTMLTGIYGGIASLSTLTSLELTAGQLSALCAMMLFAHSLPVEQSIARRAGASFWATGALRVGAGIAYGAAIAWVCHLTGALSEPMSFEWLHGSSILPESASAGYLGWLQSTAFSLVLTFAVIIVLVVVLDALEWLGITRRITTLLTPVLKISGLNAQLAPVTTVGVLLGLTYGGALIIDEAKKQNLPPRTRFLALSWLSLSHSLIEDTLLMMALGADIWIILVGRVLLTLAIVALLAKLTDRGRWSTRASAIEQT